MVGSITFYYDFDSFWSVAVNSVSNRQCLSFIMLDTLVQHIICQSTHTHTHAHTYQCSILYTNSDVVAAQLTRNGKHIKSPRGNGGALTDPAGRERCVLSACG